MPEKSRNVRVGKANSKRLLKRNASAVARGRLCGSRGSFSSTHALSLQRWYPITVVFGGRSSSIDVDEFLALRSCH